MKNGLLLIALCVFQFGFGQHQSNSKVSLSLSSLYPRTPRWNVEYVHKINETYWLGLEIGYGSYYSIPFKFKNTDTRLPFCKDYNFFEIHPELYYQIRQKSKNKYFFSIEYFYIKHTDQIKNYWYEEAKIKKQISYASANYKRIKTGFNINFTGEIDITQKVFVQTKIGAGLRFRGITLSDIVLADIDSRKEGIILFSQYLTTEGDCIGINLNFDLRIGYRF